MNSYSEIWDSVKNYCDGKLNSIAYAMWIEPLELVSLDAERIVIAAPEFKIKLISTKYKDVIDEAFFNIMGFNPEIEFVPIDYAAAEKEAKGSSGFNKIEQYQYTFDNFVVGPSNRFAYTASLRVAENPGSVFNPLFIYGNSGLGKTHLLNAIIEKLKANNPNANIVYTTSENLTNDLYFALQTKTTYDFHNKYRSCDALLVDDIQFIAGKTQTEEEVFHTFDTLVKAGKQIVFTSDKPPSAIPKIEDRLKARFESGLLCDVQPPDFETRVAIIKDKANYLNFIIPDEICSFVAENIKNNVRQIGSAVKNLYAYCSFNEVEPTIDIAKDVLKDILITSQPISVVIDNILEKVSFTFGVTVEQIKSERRDSNINNARQAGMYIIREITELSQPEIGKIFKRNHSTVNSSLKNVQNKIDSDPKYKTLINEIIKNINE